MAEITERAQLERILRTARTVAVLGAHSETRRAAFYVPDYLFSYGYRIIPVNPRFAGQTLWGERVRASLAEIGEAVDIVDVFRRSAAVAEHTADILAMSPAPRWVWLQLGIRSAPLATALEGAGIDLVQSRCMLADHEAFGIGRVE